MRVGHLRINVPAEFLFSLPNRTLQRYGLSLSLPDTHVQSHAAFDGCIEI